MNLAFLALIPLAIWGVIVWALSSCVQFTLHFLWATDLALWKCILIGFIPVVGQIVNMASAVIWLIFS